MVNREMSADWKKSLVYPDYGEIDRPGSTIANIGATIAKLFDVPFDGLSPLPDSCYHSILDEGPIERVVLIIIDAMGQNLFTKDPWLDDFSQEAHVAETITSVFPSTTVNALSSIWTGHAPSQHGLVGLRLLDRDFNAVNFMINLHPLYVRKRDAMVDAGFDPETYLAVPGIAQQFADAGISTVDIKGREIIHSALSRMHGRGVSEKIGAVSFPEMMWQVKHQLETKSGPLFTVAYWPNVDTLSHLYGPTHEAVKLEMLSCLKEIKQTLLEGVANDKRKGTAVIVTADHGQVTLNPKLHQRIHDYPKINDLLFLNAAGGNRVPYWYAKQGQVDRIKNELELRFGNLLQAYTRQEMIDNGWYGPRPFAPKFTDRLGDLNLLMADGLLMIDPTDIEIVKFLRAGSHGGLTPDEMQVPFLGFRLDS